MVASAVSEMLLASSSPAKSAGAMPEATRTRFAAVSAMLRPLPVKCGRVLSVSA